MVNQPQITLFYPVESTSQSKKAKISANADSNRAEKPASPSQGMDNENVRQNESKDSVARLPIVHDAWQQRIKAIAGGSKLEIGTAVSQGDCFFDAFAQALENKGLEIPGDKSKPPYKRLRMLCNSAIKELERAPIAGATHWVKEAMDRDTLIGGQDYQTCLATIQYTQLEMDKHKQKGFFSGLSTWGRPAIEGRILCHALSKLYGKLIRLHVTDFQVQEIEGQITPITGHRLVDSESCKDILPDTLVYDDNTVHIFNYKAHYVPLLSQSSKLAQVNEHAIEETSELPRKKKSPTSPESVNPVRSSSRFFVRKKQQDAPLLPKENQPRIFVPHYTPYQKRKQKFRNASVLEACDKHYEWGNYRFIATNNFTHFRVETMFPCLDRHKQIWLHAGTNVATAIVDGGDEEGQDWALTNIDVEIPFRRLGVGAELIWFINDCLLNLSKAQGDDCRLVIYGDKTHLSRYCLTDDGMALIRSCIDRGILKHDQFILAEVPRSPFIGMALSQ